MPETPLSHYVQQQFQRLYDRPPSSRTLADASAGAFNHGTAARILNGSHGAIDERTTDGLATALRVPKSKIRQVLGQPVHDLGRFELPRRADRLTSKERATIVSVVDVILAAHDRRGTADAPSNEGPGLRRVARKRLER